MSSTTMDTDQEVIDELRNLRFRLRNDRQIQLYIAQYPTPYIVSEALLRSISNCFALQLDLEASGGTQANQTILEFPRDDQTAWETLLRWKLNSCMATVLGDKDTQILQMIRTWAHGEKYFVKQFQDLVMMELIQTLEDQFISLEAVKLTFKITPVGSKLRKYVAREALLSFYIAQTISAADLEVFKGVDGFHTDFGEAQLCAHSHPKGVRGLATDPYAKSEWEHFMVDGGPKQHWAYQDAEEAAEVTESDEI